jgi:hypothetical protein
MKQPLLFPEVAKPRARPQVRMRVIDAGAGEELPNNVHLQC